MVFTNHDPGKLRVYGGAHSAPALEIPALLIYVPARGALDTQTLM
jgi:hypothetical protein